MLRTIILILYFCESIVDIISSIEATSVNVRNSVLVPLYTVFCHL